MNKVYLPFTGEGVQLLHDEKTAQTNASGMIIDMSRQHPGLWIEIWQGKMVILENT